MANPHPVPTSLLKLRGSWRGDARKDEPQPQQGVCRPPQWLDKGARKEWEYIAPKLRHMKVLTPTDRNALAMYCQAMSDYRRAMETVRREGWTMQQNGYTGQHPIVPVLNRSREQVLKWSAEFGITPSSRTRLQVTEDENKGDALQVYLQPQQQQPQQQRKTG